MLLPLTFHLEPVWPDHARRHLLRRPIWWLDHRDLVNLPGETIRRHLHRRPPDSAAGARGLRARDRGARPFFAGTVSTAVIATFAPPLAKVGQSFGAPEYFALMVLGLVAAVVWRGSVIKAIAMITGLCWPGWDRRQYRRRTLYLRHHAPLGWDRFRRARDRRVRRRRSSPTSLSRMRAADPDAEDHTAVADARGFPAGLAGGAAWDRARLDLGVLPGGGATLSSFAAYVLEKKVARDPSRFGHGAVEGVADPETATMPAPRPVHSNADPRHSRQRGDGADDQGP
jgi:hypothetical protein